MHTIDVIDSHTGGEPTRVVIAGFPDLGQGSLAQRRERFGQAFDHWRSAIACEPRGSDTMVGALLLQALDPRACTGVIFFNNVGYLGMCGHGTIGVVRTLAELGRIGPGQHWIETPVGLVGIELAEDGRVSIDNVESYRHAKDVPVQVQGHGEVRGDIAWGGNWFFITGQAPCTIDLAHQRELTAYTEAIRQALEAAGITGAQGGEIDHIEVNGPAPDGSGQARNFVLCPGLAYDRSPCGTGTSAKVACLAADGKLAEGDSWIQQGVLGSAFEASYRIGEQGIRPRITGTAHLTARAQLLIDPADAFAWGIGAEPVAQE
ncbi:proline racemase family protein [Pseudoxanthomonas sp.]|uniref:proline racemase family protein n=1 Tax=Pseudoxanthomonas sp. TaxID=1871049 RepID=UPI0026163375|nr:proline racemase family protein [Pseudoxanthomonas sp.]WDS36320.1 MAG: proline racemase family protein [Pseudoxanthomonas sp.]